MSLKKCWRQVDRGCADLTDRVIRRFEPSNLLITSKVDVSGIVVNHHDMVVTHKKEVGYTLLYRAR